MLAYANNWWLNNINKIWKKNMKQTAQNIQHVVSAIKTISTITSFSRKLNVQPWDFLYDLNCSQVTIVMVMIVMVIAAPLQTQL